MGLYSGGLIIGRMFASEIWGLIFGRAFLFMWGGGLLSEFYDIVFRDRGIACFQLFC